MSDVQLQRVRYVEVTCEERVRRLGRCCAPIAGVPLIAMALASWLVDPHAIGAIGAIAFLIASFGVVLTLMVPPLVATIARRRHRGPLVLARGRDELAVLGRDGRPRWRVRWNELGVAWARERDRVEILTASGDEAVLRFDGHGQARAAITTIRKHSRDRRAYPLALESDTLRLWRQCLAWFTPSAMAMVLLAAGPSMWPAAPIALALGWLGAHGTKRLVFGADGVIVQGRFARRYVAYRGIRRIERETTPAGLGSVVIRLTNGRGISLGWMIAPKRAALAQALLEEGLCMVERGEAAGARSSALEHGGLDVDAWMRSLRSATRRTSYRGAALDPERLLSIVRNPAAETAQRIAAALALRAEPSATQRIRVAAEVSTEPAVREALEVLATDAPDERRVERALRRLARVRR